MRSLTAERLIGLLSAHPAPCLSLYVPTSRTYPGAQQNRILYKDLLRQAEDQLRQQYPGGAVHTFLDRFRELSDDPVFWEHRQAGLALFGSPSTFEVFELPREVPSLAVVADSFHVKPLLRLAVTAGPYQVLCLTRKHVRLFEGDRDSLDEIDLKGVPATIEAALGSDTSGQIQGGTPTHPPGTQAGHAAKGNDAKIDAERFFQVVDRAVWEHHSRRSGLPLILAALPENQAIFRKFSHNIHLLPEGIEADPDALPVQKLREAAWRIIAPRHQAQIEKLIDDYRVARSRGKGSDDLAEVARAAHRGRVGLLLLDATRHLPGTLDPGDGSPHPADRAAAANVHDMLDDLGETVLRQRGMVVVVPHESAPSETGLAAIFRY
jgi:hypothetical protein